MTLKPIIQITIIQKQLFQRLMTLSKPNYSKAWWRCSKTIIQKYWWHESNHSTIVHEAALPKQFSNLHAAIALSTHAQNVWRRKKCAAGAKKNSTRAKTIISGTKKNGKYTKIVVKKVVKSRRRREFFWGFSPIFGILGCAPQLPPPPPPPPLLEGSSNKGGGKLMDINWFPFFQNHS